MSILANAIHLAVHAHAQQRYGEHLYIHHLLQVVEVLKDFDEADEHILAAAWLHDSLEDTALTYGTIMDYCGDRVAGLVQQVTDEEGCSRAERKERTYPKIAANPDAIRIKLADRIANVEAASLTNPKKLAMYRKEYAEFRAGLLAKGVWHQDMWDRLEHYMVDNQVQVL